MQGRQVPCQALGPQLQQALLSRDQSALQEACLPLCSAGRSWGTCPTFSESEAVGLALSHNDWGEGAQRGIAVERVWSHGVRTVAF